MYGPGAILTPANAVTLLRIAFAPVAFVMIWDTPSRSSWPLVAVWFVLSTSDLIDGRLARRYGSTRSGAFLDPLADKILVLGALFALVAADRFSLLPVALITAREVVISVFRAQLGRQGLAVPARPLAKVKTVTQEVAVGLALLPLTVDHPFLAGTALWLAVGLTLFTGAQYLMDGRAAATRLGHT
jgi:CDP-diacylglycerol--glycerol-3-phosphate 3-phosphatidyltransferase